MASNFHNILGFLAIGVDEHLGLQILAPPPGIPEFPFEELVCVHPFAMGPNWKPTVLINGVPSVVDGHTPLILWPHLPLDPENAFWPLDMLFGEHSCWLPRGTVFICDSVSTCCVIECISVNLDCNEGGKKPTDLVLQFATVKTTPSLSDFIFGVLRTVLEAAIDKALGKILDKIGGKVWKKISKKLDKLEEKADKLPHKIAVALTRKGLGYRAARTLGGGSKAVGRGMLEEFLKRSGLGSDLVKDFAKKAVGYDPNTVLQHIMGRPFADPSEDHGLNPFSGWPGGGEMLDTIPLYDKVHGGVQLLTGGGG